MASFTLVDPSIVLNGSDISSYCKSVTINYKSEIQDTTAFGDSARERIKGLKDWDMSLTFNDDRADDAIDEIMWTLNELSAPFTCVVKATSDAVSVSNPSYSGSCLIESLEVLNGSVGDLSERNTSLVGSGVLARNVA